MTVLDFILVRAGVDGMDEIDVDLVEGNYPHWMLRDADIRIGL